ncbi:MAG: hypothetical protein ACEQSA_03195 [Weeksellaceae bacterium]
MSPDTRLIHTETENPYEGIYIRIGTTPLFNSFQHPALMDQTIDLSVEDVRAQLTNLTNQQDILANAAVVCIDSRQMQEQEELQRLVKVFLEQLKVENSQVVVLELFESSKSVESASSLFHEALAVDADSIAALYTGMTAYPDLKGKLRSLRHFMQHPERLPAHIIDMITPSEEGLSASYTQLFMTEHFTDLLVANNYDQNIFLDLYNRLTPKQKQGLLHGCIATTDSYRKKGNREEESEALRFLLYIVEQQADANTDSNK